MEIETAEAIEGLRNDLSRVHTELRAEIFHVRTDLRAEIFRVHTDLRAEISEAIAPLATKEELHEAIAVAIAPLATKTELRAAFDELRTEFRTEMADSRRHAVMLIESVRDDIRIVADGLAVLAAKMDTR